jgi:Domain of unknown function (DUF4062)
MNPKYQVFISSTYEDLKDEREQVLKAVLRLGHIPIGMEMFNAANQTQWEMIKRRIEESDYYIVIIAHRYGSIEEESGLSYTEKEYDYANFIGIPTLGFVLSRSASWPGDRRDDDPRKSIALKEFIKKVEGKMRSSWSNKDELSSNVSFALNEITTGYPRIGWIRADQVVNLETINEMTRLSKENAEMRERLSHLQKSSTPMPELSVDLEIVKGNYAWYEPVQVEKSRNPYYSPMPLSPVVELQDRYGNWMSLVIKNTGNSATEIAIKLECDSPVIHLRDIKTFEDKDKGRLNRIGVTKEGWHEVTYDDDDHWSFSGSINSLKPGQTFQFLIPLVKELNSKISDNSLINVSIFPTIGEHIDRSFNFETILEKLSS